MKSKIATELNINVIISRGELYIKNVYYQVLFIPISASLEFSY